MAVVGAGGNGSIFLTHLCRIHQAWTRLGGESFTITVFDPDIVSETNLARQVFCEADIGCNKATVLAQRAAAFYGIDVKAEGMFRGHAAAHSVVVGCVDTIASRRMMQPKEVATYWLDMGNDMNTGQVVLGGNKLPTVFDLYPGMKERKEKKNLPSCSMQESLARQDLFINPILAALAGQILWRLMRQGGINHHGYVVNLNTGRVLPIPVK